jgi:hypothetical protein
VPVAHKFFPVDTPEGHRYPLCETDYFRRLGLICASCGTALRGSYITACSESRPLRLIPLPQHKQRQRQYYLPDPVRGDGYTR